jgi:hypothetical protein
MTHINIDICTTIGVYMYVEFFMLWYNGIDKFCCAFAMATSNFHEASVPDIVLSVTLTRIRHAVFPRRGCSQAWAVALLHTNLFRCKSGFVSHTETDLFCR